MAFPGAGGGHSRPPAAPAAPGLKGRLRAIYRIKKDLRRHHIRHIVINTSEISIIRDLLLSLAFRDLNITGVVHNARKLNSRFYPVFFRPRRSCLPGQENKRCSEQRLYLRVSKPGD